MALASGAFPPPTRENLTLSCFANICFSPLPVAEVYGASFEYLLWPAGLLSPVTSSALFISIDVQNCSQEATYFSGELQVPNINKKQTSFRDGWQNYLAMSFP